MKVIVDVTEDFFNWTKMCGLMPFLTKGTQIPDNATNKDVMCAFFGKVTLDKCMCIDPEWFNSPYGTGVKE